MTWVKLKPVHGRGQEPAMSITTAGRLSWTPLVDEAMKHPAEIDVMYDATRARLGIRPAVNGDGLKVRPGERIVTVRSMLAAVGILDQLELPMKSIPAVLDEAEGIWAISVKSEAELLGRSRRKRSKREEGDSDAVDSDLYR